MRATRTTRSVPRETAEPVEPVVAAPRTRGRPKENVVDEVEKPKRTTRSGAGTVPGARPRRVTNKKVTFEIAKEDKENIPVARATRQKPATGIKAKPVRKAATDTTDVTKAAGKKRVRDTAEDKDEQTRPTKRVPSKSTVLTPKKITQVARAVSPEDISEDELNGGKTPVRDLSLSPRRPPNGTVAAVIAQRLSPAKKLDFTHLTAQPVPNRSATDASLASPARRPLPMSHLLGTAPVIPASESASPRRAFGDASRLLFPTHTSFNFGAENLQLKSSQNLLQSPKRSGALNISKIFPQSESKSASHGGRLFKSSTLSSPAKRLGLFSPVRRPIVTIHEDEKDVPATEDSVSHLQEQVRETESIQDVHITSHQRASISPIQPVRLSTNALSPENLELDFNESILDIRSPLKLARSPIKATHLVVDDGDETIVVEDERPVTGIKSVVSACFPSHHATPQRRSEVEHLDTPGRSPQEDELAQFIHLNTPSILLQSCPHEVSSAPAGDDVVMPNSSEGPNETVVDAFADTSATSMLGEELQSPVPLENTCPESSPKLLDEHELTRMVEVEDGQSMETESAPSGLVSAPHENAEADVPVLLHEHKPTQFGDDNTLGSQTTPASTRTVSFDGRHSMRTPKPVPSPAMLYEHELTMIAGGAEAPSPIALEEGELTLLAACTPESESADRVHAFNTDLSSVVPDPTGAEGLNKTAEPAAMTPDQPVVRKFKLHTTISKVPLKAAMQSPSASPLAISIHKKRKRATSLGSTNSGTQVRIPLARNSATPKSGARPPLVAVSKTTETGIFSGVQAYLDIRTSDNADASPIYRDIITQCGGRVISRWTDSVSHVVYKSSSARTLDRVAEAVTAGQDIKVVSLGWVLDCQKQNTWLDETPYLIDISSLEHQAARSVGRGRAAYARRRTMEPDMLRIVADGSIRRSSSLPRIENRQRRKTLNVSIDPDLDVTPLAPEIQESKHVRGGIEDEKKSQVAVEHDVGEMTPKPMQSTHKSNKKSRSRQSLVEAWSHIPSAQGLDLGADTPARKTLDLLQRSYNMPVHADIDDSENDEEEQRLDCDETIVETGLTPAPYRTRVLEAESVYSHGQAQGDEIPGSAPAKPIGSGLMGIKERMAEIERREIRRGGRDRRRTAAGTVFGV